MTEAELSYSQFYLFILEIVKKSQVLIVFFTNPSAREEYDTRSIFKRRILI